MAHPRTCNAVEVFQKHSGTLLDAISDQVSLSWKLFQKKIITDKMLEKVQGQPEYERSSTILEAVRKAVNTKEELLLEFVSILEQTDSLAGDVAAEMRKDMNHESPLEKYCKTCDQLVCQRCTIHLHQKHDLVLVTDDLFAEQKQQIKKCLQSIEQQLSDVTAALHALEKSKDQISGQGEAVKTQIDTAVQQAWENLQESKRQLKEEVDTFVQQKLQTLSQQVRYGKEKEDQLKSCLEDVEKKMRVGSQQHFLENKHEMVEYITDVSSQVSASELEPAEEAITFTASKEALSQCTNLGEVKSSILSVVAKGKGKEVAVVGQKTSFELSTSSRVTPSFSFPFNQLSCQLTAPNNSQPVECTITPTQPRNCIVHYIPTARGSHKLKVTVGGSDIPGSPFIVCVLPTPEMRSHPLRTITELDKPWGVAVSESGEVVVTENNGLCISVFSREGEKIRSFESHGSSEAEIQSLCGVALTSDNRILVTDNHRIQVFTLKGVFLTSVGQEGNGQLQFKTPKYIAVHPSGKVFIADSDNHRIQVLNPDLSYSHMFGCKGNEDGQFTHPTGVTFDSSGAVYVTDCSNHRVQKLSVDGQFISSFGSEGSQEGRLDNPRDICIDSSDIVYISEGGYNHRVSVFSSSGQYLKCFGSKGSGEGHLTYPTGLAVDNNTGDLYVCDFFNDCVVIY